MKSYNNIKWKIWSDFQLYLYALGIKLIELRRKRTTKNNENSKIKHNE